MKIVHCIYSFTMGGAETMLTDIMNRQCARGEEVTLVVVNDVTDEGMLRLVDRRVRVIRLGRRPRSRNPLPLLRLNILLRGMRPDIIHSHSFNLLPVLPGLRSRLVYTVHDVGITDRWHGRCGALAAISSEVARELEEKGWMVTTVPNGIDFDAVRHREAGGPKEGETVRIVNVGRLMADKKGQDVLLRAAALLMAEGRKIEVTLIGAGPSEGELRELAETLGITDSVKMLGRRDREYVYSHLCDYHVMCHPSLYEGFGLTVAEGIAAGLPAVVSDSGGPYEIIGRGKYGIPFATGDPAACARALAEVIDNYPTARQLEEARSHARALYSLDRMVSDYSDLYRTLRDGR